jgi:RimJ/RimL family protein N-acetyltransferase
VIETLPDQVLARCTSLPRKPADVTLRGRVVELRPIDLDRDCGPLYEATSGAPFALGERRVDAYDPDELIWKWMRGGPHRDAGELRAYLEPDANAPDLRMLTVCDVASGAPIGVTCYLANRPGDLKIELGGIWYAPIAQRSGASREATHLMCAHAFGLGYRRVEWKCDSRNERSRRAALSYGFTFEGIQECHMIVKGRSRDTAWFRMLDREWPVAGRA